MQQFVMENNLSSLKRIWKRWIKEKALEAKATLFCLEPTGHYSNIPVAILLELNLPVWLANPLDIRQSIGLQRGKNDQVDALRIAQYAYRFSDKARLVQQNHVDRQQLKQLLSQRELLVGDRAKYATQISDFKGCLGEQAYKAIKKNNQRIVKELDKAIEQTEKQLQQMIDAIPELKEQYELLQTITGVGKVLAQTLIAVTNGFDRFDNPRALACHAGVAPFKYVSGSSVRSKNRVSHRANKRLKSLLHLAALSSIRVKGDLKSYYERKVAEGKSKMSVLNAVRNKIIHRIFAVIKRKSPYVFLEMS